MDVRVRRQSTATVCLNLSQLDGSTAGYNVASEFQQGLCCSCVSYRHAARTHDPVRLPVLVQGSVTPDKCVVCPAHGTAFDLKTGEVKGEWCPKVRSICAFHICAFQAAATAPLALLVIGYPLAASTVAGLAGIYLAGLASAPARFMAHAESTLFTW
jgi:hypothetical protein